MRIAKLLLSAALAALLTVAVTACGSSGGDSSGGGSDYSVGMILPGPINDKGFNETGYNGLQACGEAGAQINYEELVPVPQYERTYETLSQNENMVIGHGFEFGEIAAKVAPNYPDVDYVVTSNPLQPEQDNVQHLMPNSTQGAYLAGVAAGMATETNKLGGIFGFDYPVLEAQAKAFEAGAKMVNPKVSFEPVYLGTFDDVAKGKEAARSQAAAGIDVIYHIADAAGVGVINGAKEEGIYVIGWGADQHDLAPDTVIASQIVDQAKMIELACQQAIDGDFKGGELVVDGLQSGVIDLSPVYNLPEDVQAKVDEVRQQIIDGDVEVPSVGGDIPGSGEGSG